MQIPWFSLAGGLLLGVSATLLMLFNGKVAGISGIVGGLFNRQQVDKLWRVLFVLGLIGGGAIANAFSSSAGFSGIPQQYVTSLLLMLVAGFVVGIGTKLGNGCTSGHGICGMGRFSIRSIVATCVFMLVAAVTVFVRIHLL
ncbi:MULTISPECIES: YeeE/YedE family protein [Vibrio]|uniref:YeeE/YedE family protein n=1 Tax=Vibrio algicola TaxID=2662262 RepID=A0A5Q0TH08_9VIBR|nr:MULTISPECIES: YeeE/YedE family protein [Vibrio]MBD1576608.1 YeeE/YedE family protein [Vibrio sp. S11_S32]